MAEAQRKETHSDMTASDCCCDNELLNIERSILFGFYIERPKQIYPKQIKRRAHLYIRILEFSNTRGPVLHNGHSKRPRSALLPRQTIEAPTVVARALMVVVQFAFKAVQHVVDIGKTILL